MLTPGLSFLSQTRGRRQQPARHPPPPRPPHPCLAPSAQPSDERAREARGASGQGEALAMSSFVACLQPTLDGATASKLILVIRVQLGTESFLQHLPIPNPAQLNYSIFFFKPRCGLNRKTSSYLTTIQLSTFCGQSCLMYTSTHFPHLIFFKENLRLSAISLMNISERASHR